MASKTGMWGGPILSPKMKTAPGCFSFSKLTGFFVVKVPSCVSAMRLAGGNSVDSTTKLKLKV